jgi:chromosome segregation ATPase
VNTGSTVPEENDSTEAGKVESEVASSNETVAEAQEENANEETADSTEKAADADEVEVVVPDFAKMFGDLQAAIESGLEKNSTEAQEAIAKATELFESKTSELAAQYSELTTKFDSLQSELASVEKSLAAVEDVTAVKKSGDLGGSTEDTLSKSRGSKWGGFFLGTDAIE